MFESIRKNQRILQFLLLVLIFPAFVFFGVSGYDTFSSDDSLATVAGGKIGRAEFDQAQRQQLEKLRENLGGAVDAGLLDTPQARAEILEGLIGQRALLAEAQSAGVQVSDARLRAAILGIPGLTKDDGSFDMERYRSLLGAQGLNEAGFEAQMRHDLVLQTLPEGVTRSEMVPNTVLDRLIVLQEQVREVRELRFPVGQFSGKVAPTAEQMRKYYDAHPKEFETPESARIEYVALRMADIEKQVVLGANDVHDYYEQNKARYTVPEERRASHILFTVPAGASDEVRKAARARAEAALTELRAGADFAALARSQSQDPGSASQGGDLGYFGRADMVQPFADAAWKLAEGEISGVVQSEFGDHVIKLTGIRASQQKPFEQVRAEIEAELRRQQATKRYAEAAEQFSNLVYEQADSFDAVVKQFALKVHTAAALGRSGLLEAANSAPDADADAQALSNPKLLAAIFSPDSLARKQNTEAVDVGGGTLMSARVLAHQSAQRRPFEQVQAEVRVQVVQTEARAQAASAARKRLAELRTGAQEAGFGALKSVSRSAQAELAPMALEAIFRAPIDKLPSYVEVDLAGEGSAIYQVHKVVEPTPAAVAARRDSYRKQVEQLLAQQDLTEYIDSIKARAKIVRHPERLGAGGERP